MSSVVFSAHRTEVPLDKPPDATAAEELRKLKGKEVISDNPTISFWDEVLGNKPPAPAREKVDLIAQKLVTIDLEDGNRLLPKVTLNGEVFKELCKPCQDALMVKLLSNTLGYRIMKDRLKRTWQLAGDFDIMDIDNGFFMVKFDIPEDCERVLSGGPWMVFDHYLVVTAWTTEFISPEARVDKAMVWIRFLGLNLVYYDESFLLAMAAAVGKPIRVDENILKVE